MLWPILLNTHPRDAMWSLGERVTTWLRWLDDPKLLDQLVRHQVVVRASTLLDVDGRLLAQLIEAATALAGNVARRCPAARSPGVARRVLWW